MVFNSWEFVAFLLLFWLAYWSTNGKSRLLVMLFASYFFYGWWDWRFLFLIVFLTCVSYFTGFLITSSSERRRSFGLSASILISLGVLGFFKYYNFFIESFYDAFAIQNRSLTLNILLPVGVSFYTFQCLSYSIDLYRGAVRMENSLVKYATFIAFFPQLVAGPIVRAQDFLPQLQSDKFLDWNQVRTGLRVVFTGYLLKCGIADSLSVVVDPCFARPENQNSLALLVGVVFYAFQIYCDFNGYSLIAIGLALMFGYEFPKNFDRPYSSASFSEFWSRWHISLSSWLRDYLYIPLGGNRKGKLRTYLNLMITMLLGGLWHGAAWTFVVWGALHGAFLVGQRLLSGVLGLRVDTPALSRFLFRMLSVCAVFALTCIAWVFFRASSIESAIGILRSIFVDRDYAFSGVGGKFYVVKGAGLICMLAAVELLSFRVDFSKVMDRRPSLDVVYFCCCLIFIGLLGTFGGDSFIYFQF